jgi:hypothetical protein
VNLNSTDQLEFALGNNSRELPSSQLTDPTPLPSSVVRVGYRSQTVGGLIWSTAYEYRGRKNDPAEHRIELGLGGSLSEWARVFGGFRQGFGADAWDNSLTYAGLSVNLPAKYWSAVVTLYEGHQKTSADTRAIVLDVYRDTGLMGMLFNVGAGYSPYPANTSVHAKLVYPVAAGHAVVVFFERRSLGHELEATVGWRYFWK